MARTVARQRLRQLDGVHPGQVILAPAVARAAGMGRTPVFPVGNPAPEGAVLKATAIDPTVLKADGAYRFSGPIRLFTSERAAVAAVRRKGEGAIVAGNVIVLAGCGPPGTGMEEIYQLAGALRHLPFGKHVADLTDARFSGVSTGARIGHIGPEALAGGPLGRLRDGDHVRIVIDRQQLEGRFASSATTPRSRCPRPRRRRCWPVAPPIPISHRMPGCPPIPGCGPPCSKSAAGPGAVACTTWTPSPSCCG